MLNEHSMRELVKTIFPTKAWRRKVDKMPPKQLLAIVLKFREEGKL
jgi:hypothetical protein